MVELCCRLELRGSNNGDDDAVDDEVEVGRLQPGNEAVVQGRNFGDGELCDSRCGELQGNRS